MKGEKEKSKIEDVMSPLAPLESFGFDSTIPTVYEEVFCKKF